MSAPDGRRAADAGGVTHEDEKRWERSRRADRRKRWWVIAAFVVGLLAIGNQIRSDIVDGNRQDRRDRDQAQRDQIQKDREQARLYLVCGQRVAGTKAANTTVRVLHGAVLRTRQLRLVQARRTTDPVMRRAFLRSAAGYLADSRELRQSATTDCARTYPAGYRLRFRFPDLAPVQRTGGAPR